ncbi:MAG: DUF4783 domain-containing protein [Flavobacterium sp.]|nr:MAG: DUF4783 domain-containing protein [Flavobacterium sp.]
MTKTLVPILFFITSLLPSVLFQGDLVNDILPYFKTGNAKDIAKNFAPSVELGILSDSDVYSKAQAEQILRDFFSKHIPMNATVVHVIDTNPNYQVGIIAVATKTGKFRSTISYKKTSGVFYITEIRIEADK